MSYNSRDGHTAQQVAAELEARGVGVWLDQWDIRPGTDWQSELEKAIRQVGAVAILVGPGEMGPWQYQETRAYLRRAVKREIPVIPVLLPGVGDEPNLPLFLEGRSWIDGRSGIDESLLGRLEWGVLGKNPRDLERPALEEPRERVSTEKSLRRSKKANRWISGLAVLLAALLLWLLISKPGNQQEQTPEPEAPETGLSTWSTEEALVPIPRPAVAVLTFQNRTGIETLDWVGTALPEAVSVLLGIDGDIRVVERMRVALTEIDFGLGDVGQPSPRQLEQLGSALGVEHVVSGVLGEQPARSRLEVELSLHGLESGESSHWRETGAPINWFELASNLTLDSGLRGILLGPEADSLAYEDRTAARASLPSGELETELYMAGLRALRSFDLPEAHELFERAAAAEVAHPLTLANLARLHQRLGYRDDSLEVIERASRRVSELVATSSTLPMPVQLEIEAIQGQILSHDPGMQVNPRVEAYRKLYRRWFPDDASFGLLFVDAEMCVAVAGELVALLDDAPDQRRIALGDPAEHEEGGRHALVGKELQNALAVALDPTGQALPIAARDLIGEGRDLEVVLDVDGHRVGDRTALSLAGPRRGIGRSERRLVVH
ncbi:MAG: toll/interleukin-1 receptor domain-containing protein, partial [Holophagales bacterium]|nr:toll/interleukin-1 receptor domain-containing protein [Holophagales bacterium]